MPTEQRPCRADKYPTAGWIMKHAGLPSSNVASLSELLTERSVYGRFERSRPQETAKTRQKNSVDKSTTKTRHEMSQSRVNNNPRVVVHKTTTNEQNRRCTGTKYTVGTKRKSLVSNRNRRRTEQSMMGCHRTVTDAKSPTITRSGRRLLSENAHKLSNRDSIHQSTTNMPVTTVKNSLSPRANNKSTATQKYDAEIPTA